MPTFLFYSMYTVIILAGLALHVLILHLLIRTFKSEQPIFIKTLITYLASMAALIVLGFLIRLLPWHPLLTALMDVIAIFASLAVFYLFMKKLYFSPLVKTVIIFSIFYVISFVLYLGILISVRALIYEPMQVTGDNMEPTLTAQEYILINRYDWHFRRGEIIVYRPNPAVDLYVIRRIIGLPGEKIEIKDGNIYINNQDWGHYPFGQDIAGKAPGQVEITLAKNQFFTLPDNRNFDPEEKSFNFNPVDRDSIYATYKQTVDNFQP